MKLDKFVCFTFLFAVLAHPFLKDSHSEVLVNSFKTQE